MPDHQEKELIKELADRILDACAVSGKKKVDRESPEAPYADEDEYYIDGDFAVGQVEFLANLVNEVLVNFGWAGGADQASGGRWALFGEDFSPVDFVPGESKPYPIPNGAYDMEWGGGVPSFHRMLCQDAIVRGWIDEVAAPEHGPSRSCRFPGCRREAHRKIGDRIVCNMHYDSE